MNIPFSPKQKRVIDEPKFVENLLSNPRFSFIWLFIRVWLGWQWIDAATHKIGVEGWTGDGSALLGYWQRAVSIPETGRPPISFDWYRDFIQSLIDAEAYTWFAKLVAYGEFIVGVALVIGAFVGFAAFFAGLMNWNFMMAGSASTNPLLFVAAVGLILAWKTAGYIGADYYLLSWIGTPWNRNKVETPLQVKPQLNPAAGD